MAGVLEQISLEKKTFKKGCCNGKKEKLPQKVTSKGYLKGYLKRFSSIGEVEGPKLRVLVSRWFSKLCNGKQVELLICLSALLKAAPKLRSARILVVLGKRIDSISFKREHVPIKPSLNAELVQEKKS